MRADSRPLLRPDLLRVRREDEGDVAVLALEGELDLATLDEFVEATEPFAAGDALVVDTTALDFMDSSGLRELLRVHSALRPRLVVACGEDGPIRRLFQVAGLEATLTIVASRAAAIQAVRRVSRELDEPATRSG